MGKIFNVLLIGATCYIAYFLQKHLTPGAIPEIKDGYYGTGKPKKDNEAIEEFQVSVPDSMLDDVKERLEKTRFFEPLEDADGIMYGINPNYLQSVREHWLKHYDWRKYEKIINGFDHYKTEIEGMKVHYIHAKPPADKKKHVVPLLLVHGWPGSVWEFYKALPFLTDPPANFLPPGAPKNLAFEVIAPSIPGYAWSDKPKKTGFGPIACARVFNKLMSRLKFDKYYAQGGDWGSLITSIMAAAYPDRVEGLHINMAFLFPNNFPLLFLQQLAGAVVPAISVDPEDHHKVYPMGEKFLTLLQETGYFHIQATRPDTVGFALHNSPLGLASYILEKFAVWTNPAYKLLPDGGLTRHWTTDELLTDIMIYYTTGTIASSQRFYRECMNDPEFVKWGSVRVTVPTGIASCPNEIAPNPPRNHCAYKFTNITSYSDIERCGHFFAFEEPKLFALDLLKFVGELEA